QPEGARLPPAEASPGPALCRVRAGWGRNSTGIPTSGNGRSVLPTLRNIAPCLWFDDQAEEAARFYTGIFSNSRIVRISRYGEAGREIHGKPAGSVLTVDFELDGQPFTALNGGPHFRFNEAISLMVHCDTQEDVDYFWEKLSEGGDEAAQMCGWLK